MKMSISSFADAALSREQQRNVTGGGIKCTCYIPGVYNVIGSCSGTSMKKCNQMSCGGGAKNGGCYYA